MHPKIRKYWRNQGFHIQKDKYINTIYFDAVDDLEYSKCVAVQDLQGGIIYYFDNQFISDSDGYTEEEFLRVIKMKAFL
jgi:hypothetical protein